MSKSRREIAKCAVIISCILVTLCICTQALILIGHSMGYAYSLSLLNEAELKTHITQQISRQEMVTGISLNYEEELYYAELAIAEIRNSKRVPEIYTKVLANNKKVIKRVSVILVTFSLCCLLTWELKYSLEPMKGDKNA